MTFEDLGLAPDLLRALRDRGYAQPTPIQAKTIPLLLDGRDVLAGAQTGTGKTGAFVLPTLQRLAFVGQARPRQVRALVLTPTRELAQQVHANAEAYAAHLALDCAVVYGGVKVSPQVRRLAPGVDLLVATPGRLLDLAGQGAVRFDHLEVFVLDEADRMLDMGFIHDIRRIHDLLPANRQTLMFSATFSAAIEKLAARYLDDPEKVQATPANSATERVEQCAYAVAKERKTALLLHLIETRGWDRVLIFSRTKHGANRLSRRLREEGISAAPIHGNKSQNARQQALDAFRSGRLQALVATDIAARGLDIDRLPDVVNFDLPAVAEDYVHRIGRTGRAGSSGRSHSLLTPEDEPLLGAIEKLIGMRVRRESVAGFSDAAPQPSPVAPERDPAAPRRRRRRRRAGPRGGEGRAPATTGPGVREPTDTKAGPAQRSPGAEHGRSVASRRSRAGLSA